MTELRPKSTPTPSEAMQSCSEGRWRLSCRWAPSSTPTFWKIAASENPLIVEQKLTTYLPSAEQEAIAAAQAKPADAAA